MGYSAGKQIVGLDIEPGYVAAVETRPGQVAVERAAAASLAPGVVRDGEVVDVETLASVLRKSLRQKRTPASVLQTSLRPPSRTTTVIHARQMGILTQTTYQAFPSV